MASVFFLGHGNERGMIRTRSQHIVALSAMAAVMAILAPLPLHAFGGATAQTNPPCTRLAGPAGTCLTFSPDGKLLLTCFDVTCKIWNTQTSALVGPGIKTESSIQIAQFDASSSSLVLGTDNDIETWDVAIGRCTKQLVKFGATMAGLDLTPDHRYAAGILTGPDDRSLTKTAYIYDLVTGKAAAKLVHARQLERVEFLSDGKLLLSIDSDGLHARTVHLWNVPAGTEARPPIETNFEYITITESGMRPVALSPNCKRLAVAHADWVEIYDLDNKKDPVATLGIGPAGIEPLVLSIHFVDDDRLLIANSANLKIWRYATKDLETPAYAQVESIDVNLAGKWIAGCFNPLVDGHTGKTFVVGLCNFDNNQMTVLCTLRKSATVAASKDGKRVAASVDGGEFGKTLLWALGK